MAKNEKGLVMKYFVLKPSGIDVYALASRRAMGEYATMIKHENPELANDLEKWVIRESRAALRARGMKV